MAWALRRQLALVELPRRQVGNENCTLVSPSMGQTLGLPTDKDLIFQLTARPAIA